MNKIVHYLGLDVHKETIAMAIAPAGGGNGNQSAMAGLDAMKGCNAWAKRAHAL